MYLQNKELDYSMVSDILSVTTHGDEETHDVNSFFRVDTGGAIVVNQDISYENYRYFQFDVRYTCTDSVSSYMTLCIFCCSSFVDLSLFVCLFVRIGEGH